jgi:flagellar biosynthesis anti-sigma factor FlgM
MRIQGSSPNTEASAATKVDQLRSDRQSKMASSGGSGTDTVELSSDAQLASTAVQAAADAPTIRQDVVASAKQKLLSGQVGSDTASLADRLIDHLLER